MNKTREFLRMLLGPRLYGGHFYSQEGEDIVLSRYFDGQATGFYVDVGCHHPFRFSNTYLFYRRGWSGICVDPLPGTAQAFRRSRPRDRVVEVGVAARAGELVYYMFNEPALNTFDADLARKRDGVDGYAIVERRRIAMLPLAQILDTAGAANRKIDFLSVDVEGLDLEVLRSNDWGRFRPLLVIAECLERAGSRPHEDVGSFLSGLGYRTYAKTGNSVIYLNGKA